MNELIDGLDDTTATRVLSTVARARLQVPSVSEEDAHGLSGALLDATQARVQDATPTEGDLVCQTLRVLAQDEAMGASIRALATGPTPQSFSPESLIAVTAIALAVPQIRFKMSRTAKGGEEDQHREVRGERRTAPIARGHGGPVRSGSQGGQVAARCGARAVRLCGEVGRVHFA